MEIKLTWEDFLSNVISRNLNPQWFIKEDTYIMYAFDSALVFKTYIEMEIPGEESISQIEFESEYKSNWNIPLNEVPSSVRTEKEKSDIVLKMASGKVSSDSSGLAVLDIKVPGALGTSDGRYVQGGSAWFSTYHVEDKFEVHVVDKDNLLGLGAGTIIGSYTEDGPNSGFYAEPDGRVKVASLGFFGFIPSGMYLRMTGYHGVASQETLYMNIIWGQKETL